MFANMQILANAGAWLQMSASLRMSANVGAGAHAAATAIDWRPLQYGGHLNEYSARRPPLPLYIKVQKKSKKSAEKICRLKKTHYLCSAKQNERCSGCTDISAFFMHFADICGVRPPWPSRNRPAAPFESCLAAGRAAPLFCCPKKC